MAKSRKRATSGTDAGRAGRKFPKIFDVVELRALARRLRKMAKEFDDELAAELAAYGENANVKAALSAETINEAVATIGRVATSIRDGLNFAKVFDPTTGLRLEPKGRG